MKPDKMFVKMNEPLNWEKDKSGVWIMLDYYWQKYDIFDIHTSIYLYNTHLLNIIHLDFYGMFVIER